MMETRTAELNLVKHSSRKTSRSQYAVAQIGRIPIRRFPQQSLSYISLLFVAAPNAFCSACIVLTERWGNPFHAQEAVDWFLSFLTSDEGKMLDQLKSHGMQVIEPDVKAFRDAMGKVYEKYDAIWTKSLREKLQAYKA